MNKLLVRPAVASLLAALALPAAAAGQVLELCPNPVTGMTLLNGDGELAGIQFESDLGVMLPENLPLVFGTLTGYDRAGNVIVPPLGDFNQPLPTDGSFSFPNGIFAQPDIIAYVDLTAPFYDFARYGPVDLGPILDFGRFGDDPSLILNDLTVVPIFVVDGQFVQGTAVLPLNCPDPAAAGPLAAAGLLLVRRRRPAASLGLRRELPSLQCR